MDKPARAAGSGASSVATEASLLAARNRWDVIARFAAATGQDRCDTPRRSQTMACKQAVL